jgi:hypothetical protein
MSDHDELVVDIVLADELVRRGVQVRIGDRVQLQLVRKQDQEDERTAAWDAFVASFTSSEPDLAERTEEILRAEFP